MRNLNAIEWTTEMDAIIQAPTRTIAESAKLCGVSAASVWRRLQKLGGKKRKRGRKGIHWTAEMDAFLRVSPLRAVARQYGVSITVAGVRLITLGVKRGRGAPGQQRIQWTAEMDADAATLTGAAFAEKHGISRSSIVNRRARLGIKSPPGVKGGPPKHSSATILALLEECQGNASAVAARLGVSRQRGHVIVTRAKAEAKKE